MSDTSYPLLSAVTAVRNAIATGNRDALVRCVESVAALKTPHEHLIFDGASTDGTVALLRELEKRTPNLHVVSEPDTGIYNALNKGVRDAKGEWFYVLGIDDYICHPEVLDRILSNVSPRTHIVATPVERDDPKRCPFFRRKTDLSVIFRGTPCCHQGEIVRTTTMRSLGGFDERYSIAADTDLFLWAHNSGCCFSYEFTVFANYGCGGISEVHLQKAKAEFFTAVGQLLHLTDKQIARLRHRDILPLFTNLRLLFHRDAAFRIGARRHFRSLLRRIKGKTISLLVRRHP